MSVFVIAEAGSNWRMGAPKRDLQMAKMLIDIAAEAGADAVKFQVFRAGTIYAAGSGACSHLKEKGVGEPIGKVFEDLEMPAEMIPELAAHCQERGVAFMASAFSEETFRLVDPYVALHKIASPELHDLSLLKLAAGSGKATLLSTGLSTLEEIGWAAGHFKENITLLQCTVQYPTDPASANLLAMQTLAETFGLPVGLSDHTRDPIIAPVSAVALGAQVIEKHFTVHNRLVGPDHSWAITGEELAQMVRAIRLAEQMRGDGEKAILPVEEPLRRFSRRSLQALCPIPKGTPLQLGANVAILRPGTQSQGLAPRLASKIEGRRALRDIEAGSGITEQDIA
ncbi:MAG: N-acetylneuraminate synthase family protein [Parachlamydiales bacterium]